MRVIGIDIGATKIASGIIDSQGNVEKSLSVPTRSDQSSEAILEQVYKSVDDLEVDLSTIDGIGVCAPGPMSDGILVNPPNIANWRNVDLAKLLGERYRKQHIKVENDANAAGFAEMIFGVARGYKNYVYVTISTGVGMGIVIDGRIYRGKNGMAGEGGHVTIKYDDPVYSGSGVAGSIEGLASGPAIARIARQRLAERQDISSWLRDQVGDDLDSIDMKLIGRAIAEDDDFAKEQVREAGRLIGIWLGSIVSLLDPEMVVVGGGVAKVGEPLFASIRDTLPSYTINSLVSELPIKPAQLKDHVGVYGAASLIYESEKLS